MTGPAPHVCDESCACPVHGTRLLYSPAGGEHACQDPDCVHAHGLTMVVSLPCPLRNLIPRRADGGA